MPVDTKLEHCVRYPYTVLYLECRSVPTSANRCVSKWLAKTGSRNNHHTGQMRFPDAGNRT